MVGETKKAVNVSIVVAENLFITYNKPIEVIKYEYVRRTSAVPDIDTFSVLWEILRKGVIVISSIGWERYKAIVMAGEIKTVIVSIVVAVFNLLNVLLL